MVFDAKDDGADDDRGQGRPRDESAVGHQEGQGQENHSTSQYSTLQKRITLKLADYDCLVVLVEGMIEFVTSVHKQQCIKP